MSSLQTRVYPMHGLKAGQYDLRRLESVVHNELVHLITGVGSHGRGAMLLGLEWNAISLAKMLEKTRVLVLQIPAVQGPSAVARSLLLRNALAAELFELTELQLLIAVGPLNDQDVAVVSIARVVSMLAGGHILPQDTCHNLCLWSPDLEAVDLGSFATTAVFCDESDRPIVEPSSAK